MLEKQTDKGLFTMNCWNSSEGDQRKEAYDLRNLRSISGKSDLYMKEARAAADARGYLNLKRTSIGSISHISSIGQVGSHADRKE